jgi:NAD(P)-dependent dehydrogenase (short-subunit alcohol dehydrogenase family)
MDIAGRIAVVTGAASGIGRALCLALHEAGAARVICADMNKQGAQATAEEIGGVAVETNVGREEDLQRLVETTEADIGPIDLFVSNAGIIFRGGLEIGNDDWQQIWDVNVMAHVWAARHVVPRMAARGGGYLLNTASAAGLLNQVGAAPYAVTKHAAVGLAEWLALTYGDQGIKVSVLCPQAVRTGMTADPNSVAAQDGLLEPGPVADLCLQAIRDETFLVLPHPEVLDYMRRKTTDYDRWIAGMQRHGFRGAAEIAATLDHLASFANLADAVGSHLFDIYYDATLGDDAVRDFLATPTPRPLPRCRRSSANC